MTALYSCGMNPKCIEFMNNHPYIQPILLIAFLVTIGYIIYITIKDKVK